MLTVGIDIGGTFTDVVVIDEQGRMTTHKVLSTPPDFARAIFQALDELGIADEFELVHGATVATNAVLERKGAKTALITTKGFRDVLEIGRQNRPKLYDLFFERPAPLVPRELRLEVNERLDWQGNVLAPLNRHDVEQAIERLKAEGVEAVAVCFLFSFANPEHERIVAESLRAVTNLESRITNHESHFGWFVTASHEVLPEFREYERTATTVLNAYVGPVMCRYLSSLQEGLRRRGAKQVRIMQSSGGSISVEEVMRLPVHTMLSGPAAGVVGALSVAKQAGFSNIITFDMGGTSTDVSLCIGQPQLTSEGSIGGVPLMVPTIAIHSVGAGGGSIAYLDAAGALKVGPESAGADPGPVCYGKGNQITVTDANLMLGRLDPERFLGGRMKLDVRRARESFESFAKQLGTSVEEAAESVIAVVNSNMERALKVISVERGYDPRDFVLVAFGGAGGLHACALADALEIKTVLIPRNPGVLSALGTLIADVVKTYSQTIAVELTKANVRQAQQVAQELSRRAMEDLVAMGFSPDRIQIEVAVDARYVGQGYEIGVGVRAWSVEAIREAFEAEHERLYAHRFADKPVEIVTVRVRGIGLTPKPTLERILEGKAEAALVGEQQVFYRGWMEAKVYEREKLGAGAALEPPALILEAHASSFLPPGWRAQVDAWGNLIMTKSQ